MSISNDSRARIRKAIEPIALGLGGIGLTPNALTVIGFVGTCGAAMAAGLQAWTVAGILVLAFGIFDMFDGALARASGRTSAFGAFLDSTLDRLGENLVYAGVAIGATMAGFELGTLLAALAMATASVVTYTRARAEALGMHGEVGIAPRPERLVALSVGLILAGVAWDSTTRTDSIAVIGDFTVGQLWLTLGLGLIVVTSSVTVIQRILHVRQQAKRQST
jgi:CDP-diacylglycerol--glycerol-3-phosphate 3-phosphatidyltransferase